MLVLAHCLLLFRCPLTDHRPALTETETHSHRPLLAHIPLQDDRPNNHHQQNMARSHANLSNCYKPLPYKLVHGKDGKEPSKSEKDAEPTRRDAGNGQARSSHELRVLRIEVGVTSAPGSALVELGHTKVLCEVIGPTPAPNPNITTNMEEGTLECQVQYLPNFGFPVTSLVGASASALSDSAQQPPQPTMGRINTQIGKRCKGYCG